MPDSVGQQVGEYRLVRRLGGGGFGTVYLALHVHEHTQAAVKVLDIRLTKSEDFKAFLNEARTVRLRHPHIVPLLDFGISRDDLPFLVMEYASSGTLRDRHRKGERVALPTIVSYVDQVGSALKYGHDRRVIHRDVKPDNILVRDDGTLMLSDFGIAKLLEQSVLMSTQTQVGTPAYMAPEQHMGHPCFASDQYALAVVVYEWICGVRPFQGTLYGLAIQHKETEPPPLRDHLPAIASEVEQVVLKALAKDPEDRYGGILAFADALREAVQSSPGKNVSDAATDESATTLPPAQPSLQEQIVMTDTPSSRQKPLPLAKPASSRWQRRRVVGALAIMVSLAATGGVTAWFALSRAESGSSITPIPSRPSPPLSSPVARPVPVDQLSLLRTLSGHTDIVYSVAISADGQTLVSGIADNVIRLLKVATRALVRTLSGHTSTV